MEIFSYVIRIYFYVKLTTNWSCHDSSFVGDVLSLFDSYFPCIRCIILFS